VILLVSGGTRWTEGARTHPNLGSLIVPASGNRLPLEGVEWAADNGAFKAFDEKRYLVMLKRISGHPGCRFVTAPDVVADAEATLSLLEKWGPIIREEYGLPVALVLQNELTVDDVPWDRIDATFIGGTTAYKLGPDAARITAEANRRGLWTHMGRVNTFRRIAYAMAIGCKSVDGTKYSRWAKTYTADALAMISAGVRQQPLTLVEGHR